MREWTFDDDEWLRAYVQANPAKAIRWVIDACRRILGKAPRRGRVAQIRRELGIEVQRQKGPAVALFGTDSRADTRDRNRRIALIRSRHIAMEIKNA